MKRMKIELPELEKIKTSRYCNTTTQLIMEN